MTPFAVAGIQMTVSAEAENIAAMGKRLSHLMHRFPWVQMVLFSELAAFGPAPKHAQPLPGPAEAAFCEMAARHHVWLIPGSLFERDVELPIARANAAINQCYFFDINGIGDGGTGRSIIVGPSGHVIHEAGAGPEFMPVEIDLDRVRRERERGIRGLGQTLKSFRDRPVDFPVYQRSGPTETYLHSLGPVQKQGRHTEAEATPAVHVVEPSNVVPPGPTHA